MKNFEYCNGIIYTIKKGDTLYGLSGKFRVPLAVILRANPYVDIYNLQIGDQICIPIAGGRFPITIIPYIVKDNDTLMKILDYFNLDLTDFLKYNNLNEIKLKSGMTLQIPSANAEEED